MALIDVSRRVVKPLLILVFFIALISSVSAKTPWADKSLIRLKNPTPGLIQVIQHKNLVIANEAEIKDWIDVWVDQEERQWLASLGWEGKKIIDAEQLMAFSPALSAEFHDYNEMVQVLDSLETVYPGLCHKESLGVSTQLQRIMWGFKISDNADTDEDEPVVLYDGAHHACEVMGFEINMRLIYELLAGYGVNPQVTNWVNNTEIWFVPLVNVDGHEAIVNDISYFWRKNARDLDGDGILYEYLCNDWWTCSTEGIDLNRNYDWYWSNSGSPDPWNYYYRGTSGFSEGETQAVRDLAREIRPNLYITYHSYGEVIYYPWYGAPNPDQTVLDEIAYQIASNIITPTSPYGYGYGVNYYNQGMSFLWMYGTLGTLGFLIETLPYPYFIPPGLALDSVYSELRPGITYILDRAQGPGARIGVTDSTTGLPLSAKVELVGQDYSAVMPRYTDSTFGCQRLLLQPGYHTVRVSHSLYFSRTLEFYVSGSDYTQVNLTLQPRPSGPAIVTMPDSVSLSLFADTLVNSPLSIINEGLDTLDFQITTIGASWLSLTGVSGNVLPVDTQVIQLQINTSDLSGGVYYETLTVASNDPNHPSEIIPVQLTVNCLLKPMDINFDGQLTLADVIYLVNYVFNRPGFTVTYLCQGDLDAPGLPANSSITLADVIGLVNWVLKGNPVFQPWPNRACCLPL